MGEEESPSPQELNSLPCRICVATSDAMSDTPASLLFKSTLVFRIGRIGVEGGLRAKSGANLVPTKSKRTPFFGCFWQRMSPF